MNSRDYPRQAFLFMHSEQTCSSTGNHPLSVVTFLEPSVKIRTFAGHQSACFMEIVTLLLLAIGLSFDSFAVSVSSGLILPQIRFYKACIIAFSLAFFQAMMPMIGWLAGISIREYLTEADHWIAFGLLSLLGLKMIYDSIKPEEQRNVFNPLNPLVLITMSLATSIDALVVGITFAFIVTPDTPLWMAILLPVAVIGTVTFIVSMLGILFGKKAGLRLGKRMEMLGGFILIGIGVKILVEHLCM